MVLNLSSTFEGILVVPFFLRSNLPPKLAQPAFVPTFTSWQANSVNFEQVNADWEVGERKSHLSYFPIGCTSYNECR